jgi:hypothetical protein
LAATSPHVAAKRNVINGEIVCGATVSRVVVERLIVGSGGTIG